MSKQISIERLPTCGLTPPSSGRFKLRLNLPLMSNVRSRMEPHEFIEGHEIVLAQFAEWPSFHDGEIHRLLLDSTRRGPDGWRYPSIELDLRGWIMTNEVTGQGFYRCKFDSVVSFLFERVSLVELEGLNHQNVLSCLNLELLPSESGQAQLKVDLEHCYGLSGSFVAASAKILKVTPYAEASAT